MSRDKAEIIAYAIRKECQKCYWYETYGITFDEFEEFLSNGIKGIDLFGTDEIKNCDSTKRLERTWRRRSDIAYGNEKRYSRSGKQFGGCFKKQTHTCCMTQ